MVKSVETTKNSDGTSTKTTTYDDGSTHSVRTEPGVLWDHVVSTKDTPPKK